MKVTQPYVNVFGKVSIYILYILSDYTFLQSILTSCRWILKLNVLPLQWATLIGPSQKKLDVFNVHKYVFFLLIRFCESASLQANNIQQKPTLLAKGYDTNYGALGGIGCVHFVECVLGAYCRTSLFEQNFSILNKFFFLKSNELLEFHFQFSKCIHHTFNSESH